LEYVKKLVIFEVVKLLLFFSNEELY